MSKLSGGLNSYYVIQINDPQRKEQAPYQAECEDIIQALGMTFDEGCAFKALWRNASARLGNGKPGNKSLYEAEKLVHYSERILKKEQLAQYLVDTFHNGEYSVPVNRSDEQFKGWITVWMEANSPSIQPSGYKSIEVVLHNGITCTYYPPTPVPWGQLARYKANYS